jgi:TRAP-type C4-dicarboxylate transport system substrate-binding protein
MRRGPGGLTLVTPMPLAVLTLVLLAAAAAAGGCLGGGESDKAGGERPADAVVLRLANHDSSLDLDEYVDAVERLSSGSIRIELENGWRKGQVDYEPRTIDDVRDGGVEMAKVSARAFDTAGVRSLQPLVAPFVVDSYALQREVLRSDVAAEMLRGVERLDLVGVALLPGDLRRPFGVGRPLVEVDDYRGARIATRMSRLGFRTFDALGAAGEPVTPSADVSSFDGAENGIENFQGNTYSGPRRELTMNVALWPRSLAIVMNRDAWEDLSEEQRDVLRDAGRAALDRALDRIRSRDREALGVICRGREVTINEASPGQLQALREATAEIARELERDPSTRAAVREIEALKAEVEPEEQPGCGAAAPDRPGGGATPVDGLWRMTSTREEYAAIAPPSDVVPENWGEFTFAFRGGRFAATTENGEACLWLYGRYAVRGDIVEWTVEDGGGISVTEEDFFNQAGEFFTYRWSRYRDRLTLEPVQGAVSAEPYRVNAWRLLDGEPAVAALARRCRPPSGALQP